MASPCNGDPVRCIDFAALFVLEYLNDWSTLLMLTTLLVLLFMLRAEREKAAEADYVRHLEALDDKRDKEARGQPLD